MTLNWIGLIAAVATFMGVWIGHVFVRKIEYISPTVWVPSGVALFLGLLLELGALVSEDPYLSAALGIFGITVLWDALEFWRQHQRVRKGHAPANPNNPRHARMLQTSGISTTIDWLDRNPIGRQLSTDELQGIQEGAR
jgi:putative Mn2+ efflux pump MntP